MGSFDRFGIYHASGGQGSSSGFGYSPTSYSSAIAASAQAQAARDELAQRFADQEAKSHEGSWLGNAAREVKDIATGVPHLIGTLGSATWHDTSNFVHGFGGKDSIWTMPVSDLFSGQGRHDLLHKLHTNSDLFDKVVAPIGQGWEHLYSPLAHGDFHEFAKRWKEDPLAPFLDVLGVMSGGLGFAAKGAEVGAMLGEGGAAAARAARFAGKGERVTLPERQFIVGSKGAESTANVSRAEEIGRLQARYGGKGGGKVIVDRGGGVYIPRPRTLTGPTARLLTAASQDASKGDATAGKLVDANLHAPVDTEIGGMDENPWRRMQQASYDYLSERFANAPVIGVDKRLRANASREARAAKTRFTDTKQVAKSSAQTTRSTGAVAKVRSAPYLMAAQFEKLQGVPLEMRGKQVLGDIKTFDTEKRKAEHLRGLATELSKLGDEAATVGARAIKDGADPAAAASAHIATRANEWLARIAAPAARVEAKAKKVDRRAASTAGKYRPIENHLAVDEKHVREVNGQRLHNVASELETHRKAADKALIVAERIARKPGASDAAIHAAMSHADELAAAVKRFEQEMPATHAIIGRGPGKGVHVVSIDELRAAREGHAKEIRDKGAVQQATRDARYAEVAKVAKDPASLPDVVKELDFWATALPKKDLWQSQMVAYHKLVTDAMRMSPKEQGWVEQSIEKLGPMLDQMNRAVESTGVSADVARREVLAQLTVGFKMAETTPARIVPHSIEDSSLRSSAAGVGPRRLAKPGRTSAMRHNTGMSYRLALSGLDPQSWVTTMETAAEYKKNLRMYEEAARNRLVIPLGQKPPRGFVVANHSTMEQMRKTMDRFEHDQAPLIFGDNQHAADMLVSQMRGFFQAMKPNQGSYVVIPERYARALDEDMTKSITAAGQAFDQVTGVWRTVTLRLRPAWATANVVGNAIMMGMSHGVYDSLRAILATKDPEVRAVLDEHMGALRAGGSTSVLHDTQKMAHKGRKPGEGIGPKVPLPGDNNVPLSKVLAQATVLPGVANIVGWFNQITDDFFRRSAFYAEIRPAAERIMHSTGASFADAAKTILDDPRAHSAIEKRVLGDMIDFHDLSRMERLVVRKASPFYAWIKGATKREAQYALDNPVRTAVYAEGAQQTNDNGKGLFGGKVPDFLSGALPVPDAVAKHLGIHHGEGHRNVFVTGSFNPLQTPADVAGQASWFWDRNASGFGPDNPAATLNPIFRVPLEAAFGRDLFSGQEVKGNTPAARALYQTERSTPIAAQLANLWDVHQDPSANDNKLYRVSKLLEAYKWAGLPVRDVNVDVARRIGDSQRQQFIANYPTLHQRADGTYEYASYYNDPKTGTVFGIRPFLPQGAA